MKRIVCDTGPLVHLFEANLLDLLAAAGKILIPAGVADELGGVAPELTGRSSPRPACPPRFQLPNAWYPPAPRSAGPQGQCLQTVQ